MADPFVRQLFEAHKNSRPVPQPSKVCNWLNGLLKALFPELSDSKYESLREFELHFHGLQNELLKLLLTLEYMMERPAVDIEEEFMRGLDTLHASLMVDAQAIFEGDPASVSIREVIRSYPGFYAMAVYRIAHLLYTLKTPLIPRVLTEYAHSQTGIDIHPGAQIGDGFCIDHGTGLVIGETVEIGKGVKIYQGVTLGAMSVKKELAKTKRHPTIEDNVVIYSGATILGGNTVIGHSSIIGGNVWITESIPPYSRVYYTPELKHKIEQAVL